VPGPGIRVWSIGHSTHAFDAFVELLRANGIERVADIRTVPKSRRHPHFHTDHLARELPAQGIAYGHLAALGGWRHAAADSPNGGWRNASFRGYADYAMTAEFAAGLDALRSLAAQAPTAMMCSEALWWRCHRRLVADVAVLGRGVPVEHLMPDGRLTAHRPSEGAVLGDDGEVRWPAQ
jgi:uncharacterized protein (DUF488 family)